MDRSVAGRITPERIPSAFRPSPPAAPPKRLALLAVARADVRWSLRQQLSSQGFAIFATGDARIALKWLATRSPELVISDVLLPGTHTAVPHVLRRQNRAHLCCPKMIGLTEDASQSEALERVLGFDLVLQDRTPTVVITKAALRLVG